MEQPRVAEAAPPDHGHVRSGERQNADGVLRRKYIAVGDDGDAHRLLYLPDGRPVRLTGVHLGAGAAVHRDGADPRLLQHLRQLHGVDAALVPAPAHLDRHRYGTGLHHRLGDAGGLLRLLHQGGAVAVGHHLAHGAAHVDVDDRRAGHLRRDGGGLGHAPDIAAEDLGGGGALVARQLQKAAALFVLIAQGLGADQLGAAHVGAQLPADLTKRQIRDAGHGGQIQFSGDVDGSDVHGDAPFCVGGGGALRMYCTTKKPG